MNDVHLNLPTVTPPIPKEPSSGAYRRFFIWLAIGLLFFAFLYAIRTVLLPFVAGILIAYFLDPAADKLEKHGARRSLASGGIICGFFLVIALVGMAVLPSVFHQLGELIQAIPEYVAGLKEKYGHLMQDWLSSMRGSDADAVKNAFSNAAGGVMDITGSLLMGALLSGIALINLLSLLLIMPLVAFYMLRDWDMLVERLDALIPLPYQESVRTQMRVIDRTLAGFIRGQLNVCLILAVYYAVLLSVVGLQFGLIIGIVGGLLVILPYLGFFIALVAGMGMAFYQFGMEPGTWAVAGIYAGAQVLESYFLTPKLVGDKVGLHPLWIIFGMLAGGAMFGFVGVLIAVPVTAIVGVLIRFAIRRYLRSELYTGV